MPIILSDNYNYNIYFDFIEAYLPNNFRNINPTDPIIEKLDNLMEFHDQMLLVMDITNAEIIYTSKQSVEMLGIESEKNDPFEMMERVHKDDIHRFGLGRAKLLEMDSELFSSHGESKVFSSNFRMRKPDNTYCNHLFQIYLFYNATSNTVYLVQINTNIDKFEMKEDTFQYYAGNDETLFRFPDKELLEIGHKLTLREFEILELLADGHSSDEIAEKLSVSVHTVRTHRKNIMEKYDKTHLTDIIVLFKDQGLL